PLEAGPTYHAMNFTPGPAGRLALLVKCLQLSEASLPQVFEVIPDETQLVQPSAAVRRQGLSGSLGAHPEAEAPIRRPVPGNIAMAVLLLEGLQLSETFSPL